MNANAWHTEKSYIKSGWCKVDSYTGTLPNFRRLPPRTPTPQLNRLTLEGSSPQPYSAEALRGQPRSDTDELLKRSARIYPIPTQMQLPQNRVLEHYGRSCERQARAQFKVDEVERKERESADRRRRREQDKKKNTQEKRLRMIAVLRQEGREAEIEQLEVSDASSASDSSVQSSDGESDENDSLSEDELPDLLFEQGFSSEHKLQQVLANTPDVQRLHLNGRTSLSPSFFCHIAPGLPNLQSLNLSGCQVNDAVAACMLQYCQKLVKLNLSSCREITYLDLSGQVHIQELRLSRCSYAVSSELVASLKMMRKLSVLDISYCSEFSDVGLQGLAQGCRAMTWLDMSTCSRITGDGVITIAEANPNIRHLFLMLNEQATLTDEQMARVVRHLERLQVLDVTACPQLSRMMIFSIARHCQYLEKLGLAGLEQITGDDMRQLMSKCSALEWLDLSGCGQIMIEPIVDGLQHAKRLRTLVLNMVPGISEEAFIQLQNRYPAISFERHCRNFSHPDDFTDVLRIPPKPPRKKKRKKGAPKGKAAPKKK